MNTGNLPVVYTVRIPPTTDRVKHDHVVDSVVFSNVGKRVAEACLLRSSYPLIEKPMEPDRMLKVCKAVVGAYRARHQGAGCFVCGRQVDVSCYLMPQGGPLVVILCCNVAACADVAMDRVDAYLDECAKQ